MPPGQTFPLLGGDPFLTFLQSIARQHVHYFPKSGNAGDGFVSYATYKLFDHFNITFTSHIQSDTVEGQIVLIGGGGNLIEGRTDDVANLIRRHVTNNRVVLLPHTIAGFGDVLAETHRQLTIFCREPISYRLSLLNGAKEERTHLSHDLTFFLEDSHFSEFFKPGSGILKALRQDDETAAGVPISPKNIDILLSWNGDLWTSPDFSAYVTKSMAAFISSNEVVETDRLHVSILSAFLKKRVCLLPSACFKNRAIFEHSLLPRFPNVEFVNTLPSWDGPTHSLGSARFLRQGERISESSEEPKYARDVASLSDELVTAREKADREVALREIAERELELRKQNWKERWAAEGEQHKALHAEHEALSRNHNALLVARECLVAQHEALRREHETLRRDRENLSAKCDTLSTMHRAVSRSTSWRLTYPLRAIGSRTPLGLRRFLHRALDMYSDKTSQ